MQNRQNMISMGFCLSKCIPNWFMCVPLIHIFGAGLFFYYFVTLFTKQQNIHYFSLICKICTKQRRINLILSKSQSTSVTKKKYENAESVHTQAKNITTETNREDIQTNNTTTQTQSTVILYKCDCCVWREKKNGQGLVFNYEPVKIWMRLLVIPCVFYIHTYLSTHILIHTQAEDSSKLIFVRKSQMMGQ